MYLLNKNTCKQFKLFLLLFFQLCNKSNIEDYYKSYKN